MNKNGNDKLVIIGKINNKKWECFYYYFFVIVTTILGNILFLKISIFQNHGIVGDILSNQLKYSILVIIMIFVFLFLDICLTYIHEYSHYFCSKLFGYKTKIHVKFDHKFKWKMIERYCEFDHKDQFKRKTIICIALAPFVLLLFIFLIIKLTLNFPPLNLLWMLLFILKIYGCSNDLLMVFQVLLFYDKESLFSRIDDKIGFKKIN